MAIDPKKTMVKVKKSMLTEEEIAAAKAKAAKAKKESIANTPEMIKKFQGISDYNKKAVANESMAKRDSIGASKKHLLENLTNPDREKAKAMAGRAGNTAANDTRNKTGNGDSKVTRFASVSSGGTMDNSRGQQDKYLRNAPIEKDFPTNVKKK
jgi:hypothetical protein